jgi:glutamine cyclotransferase
MNPRCSRSALALLASVVCVALLAMSPADARQGGRAPVWRYDVVRAYPHDADAFTQGLVYQDGFLYESTGLNGRSSLRRVALETGRVVQRVAVDRRYFAEGLASWGPYLLQLTWDTGIGFVYDRASFKLLKTFTYAGEGWGFADDGKQLVLSDGSPTLKFLDPATFAVTRRVTVRDGGRPIEELNELEVVKGLVYANVWQTPRIAIIAPADGRVVAWLELSRLTPKMASPDAVLNGIAYDAAGDRLFVTGKFWPQLFEIKVHRP